MKIFLNENKLLLIKEAEEEKVTFYKFFTEVKNFIQDLLDNPIEAKPSGFFKTHGISRSILLNKLIDRDIISKKENIDEPYDADGNRKSMHSIQYKVPRKNFEQKIKRLYSYFFENEKRKKKLTENIWNNNYDSVATYIFCKDLEGNVCVLGGRRRGGGSSGLYNVPTGHVGDHDPNENILDAAAREVAEESGLNIPKGLFRFIGKEMYRSRYGECLGANYAVVFKDTTDKHKPGIGDGENDRFQWIPLNSIDSVEWAFDMDNTIKKIYSSL